MIPGRPIKMLMALLAATVAGACGGDDGALRTPTTVTVSPDTTLSSLKETVRLTATVEDQNGAVMSRTTVKWESSSDTIATVDESGLVTAVKNGQATVTATAGSASGSATVMVDQVANTVVINGATHKYSADGNTLPVSAEDTTHVRLAFGDTLQLLATARDANGHSVAGAEIKWTTGDTRVAVVTGAGLVTGKSEGAVRITAQVDGAVGSAIVDVTHVQAVCLNADEVARLPLATALRLVGLQHAHRTTVRRRERSTVMRVDEVVDTVAWWDAANADSTIVLAAHYNRSTEDSHDANPWPMRAALAAAGRLIHCDSPPTKNLVLTFTDIRNWERLRLSARDQSVIYRGADVYDSHVGIDGDTIPVPFLPRGSPDDPALMIELVYNTHFAYPAFGTNGPLLPASPRRAETETAEGPTIKTLGVIKPRSDADTTRLSTIAYDMLERASTSSFRGAQTPVIRPDYVDRIRPDYVERWPIGDFARRLWVDSNRFDSILRYHVNDVFWLLSIVCAVLVAYIAIRYTLVGPKTRFRRAKNTRLRITRWERKHAVISLRRALWKGRTDDYIRRWKASKASHGAVADNTDSDVVTSQAGYSWVDIWRLAACLIMLGWYRCKKWYYHGPMVNNHKDYGMMMDRYMDQHGADLDRAKESQGRLFEGLRAGVVTAMTRNVSSFALGFVSALVALGVTVVVDSRSQENPLDTWLLCCVAVVYVILAAMCVAFMFDGAKARMRHRRSPRPDDEHRNPPRTHLGHLRVAFSWGAVAMVSLGLTTIEFTSVGGELMREAFDSQRVNLLILGAGILLAVRTFVIEEHDEANEEDRKAEMDVICETTRWGIVRWWRRRVEKDLRFWHRVWLASAAFALLAVLFAAGWLDIYPGYATGSAEYLEYIGPIASVTLVTMSLPIILPFLKIVGTGKSDPSGTEASMD